jgi:hypothetical protein
MVTIQKTNLNVTAVEAIRDLLRNNLTNPTTNTGAWIYKDNPETDFKESDYPVVTIEEAGTTIDTMGMKGSRTGPTEINLTITVYHNNTYQRDTISDEIRSTLLDTTKIDAEGDNLWDNNLRIKNLTTRTADVFIDHAKMLRVKELQVTLRYYGG